MKLSIISCLTFTTALLAQSVEEPLDRKKWLVNENFGVGTLSGRAISSALSTWRDSPPEYNTNWSGYGQRYAMRMANTGVRSVMEVSLGAALHEDPQYHKASGTFKQRVVSVLKQTVTTYKTDGTQTFAYARLGAVAGSSFLSNTWRPASEATASDATIRIGYGLLSRMASNTLAEFGSDIGRLFRRRPANP